MPFIPHTTQDVQEMLEAIGAPDIEALFEEIPAALRVRSLAGVPEGLNEQQVMALMYARARQDGRPLNFIGAGAYEHHIPAAVWAIVARGEFYSAYTPYQAEASQGTLQTIYEYQSMISALTGLQVANASLYDGATAAAEACLMAVRANRKSSAARVLIPRTVHPNYRAVAQAATGGQGLKLEELAYLRASGQTAADALSSYEGQDVTALVIQQPNFFGVLEEVDALTDWAHARGALVIAVVNPISLAVLKPPGSWGQRGADIVVGDGQGRRAAARLPAVFRRAVFWLHGHAHGLRAPDARAHRRAHRRSGRPAGLHPDPAGARAAHPPRQGHLEHLHQPGPADDRRHHLLRHDGRGRPGTRCAGVHGAHRATGPCCCSTGRSHRSWRRSPPTASRAASISGSITRNSATRCWSAPPRRARPPTSRPTPRGCPNCSRSRASHELSPV